MATYDRTANRQDKKKGKKNKGGGQQPARKRKLYSDMIPFRKIARMLKSSGAQFVGEMAHRLKHDVAKGDNGVMADHLATMANSGHYGDYGRIVWELAQKAMEFMKPAPDAGHACSSCPDCGVEDVK